MADLVTVADMVQYLGDSSLDPLLVSNLLEGAEALFEAAVNRTSTPFRAAQAGRVEVRDGTGQPFLYVQYPIATLTSVVLGLDPTKPDETLAIAEPSTLRWAAGSPRLVRTDGRAFGWFGMPGYVQVTYDAADDRPTLAALAVKTVTAQLLQTRGSEALRSETLGPWSASYARDLLTSDPTWQHAVGAFRVVNV